MFGKTLPLKEKLRAAGAFGGIAFASVVALDLIVTNGWQIDPPPTRLEVNEPSPTYISMMDGGWRSNYSYSAVSWSDPLPIDDAQPVEPVERLAGAPGEDDPNYRTAHYNVPSEDELYREIAELYAGQEAYAAEAERRAEEREASMREADLALSQELQQVETVVDEQYREVRTHPDEEDEAAIEEPALEPPEPSVSETE